MTFNNNHTVDNNAAATKTNFVSNLPDLNRPRKHIDKLPILISSRVRLSDQQRETLKQEWRKLRDSQTPEPTAMPGSTVRAYGVAKAESALKTSSLIISDIISSRDTIPLSTIFELERLFDIELITEEQFLEACRGYYIFNRDKNDG